MDPGEIRQWVKESGIPVSSLFEKFRRDNPRAARAYTLEQFTTQLMECDVLLIPMLDGIYALQKDIGTIPLCVSQFRAALTAPEVSEDAKLLAEVLLAIMINPH